MENQAQHGGRILPGREEHDLVARESNETSVEALSAIMSFNWFSTISLMPRWVPRCSPVTSAAAISSAWRAQEPLREYRLFLTSGMWVKRGRKLPLLQRNLSLILLYFTEQGLLMVLLLGWLFLPIYIASGVNQSRTKSQKCDEKSFSMPLSHFPTRPPAGEDHAGVLTEALWWEKNADIHSHPVSVYLHFHKDIGKIISQSRCLRSFVAVNVP